MYLNAQELSQALGGRWHGHYGLAFCPAHENHQTPALNIAMGATGKPLLYCFGGCAYRDILLALEARGLRVNRQAGPLAIKAWTPTASAASKWRADRARQIWQETTTIPETLAERYLRGRGLRQELPDSLRYHPNCWHGPSARSLPAMVAIIDNVADFAIHRTYLTPDGSRKAAVGPQKMMLGASAGGAVHLGCNDACGPLVIAEGIETALSLREGLLTSCGPVWAALSTSGMVKLELPRTASSLVVATDGDEAGRRAGRKLAQRAYALGWQVSLLDAPDKRDWNDILMTGEFRQ
ncbi:toprim domain-containing protein [Maritimibacter alkaliphilus]|uniref:DUF7146 domain-containing protein n=1 Tax=Maritimibacter alkaliphilus TaxID=404236 RepID=UPI001C965693|nr:toprim domain-containing protein [Maritimibacter alkaliphilus]MBY6088957.1 toprim domain-containing protein [Maritimibacter alkaliphilus]